MGNRRSNPEFNYRGRLRAKARLLLPLLLSRTNGKCQWCGDPLVLARELPPNACKCLGYVSWTDAAGVRHRALYATVDHLKRITDGGTNDIYNLVPACHYCNCARGEQDVNSTLYTRRAHCNCGRPKLRRDSRCQHCRVLRVMSPRR